MHEQVVVQWTGRSTSRMHELYCGAKTHYLTAITSFSYLKKQDNSKPPPLDSSPSGYGDGLLTHWGIPAQVRVLQNPNLSQQHNQNHIIQQH